MLEFAIDYVEICFKGQAQYIKQESSFLYHPWNDVNFAIIIGNGYNSLDVNLQNNLVMQVTGLNPSYNWIKKDIIAPFSRPGILKAFFHDTYCPGTGIQYATDWKTYFNEKTGWVCIGNPNHINKWASVEFAANTIAVIANGQIESIWIKPIFI